MNGQPRSPSLVLSVMPVLVVMVVMGAAIVFLKASAHLPLIIGSVVVVVLGLRLGHSWKDLQQGMVRGISMGLPAILILLAIGILVGSWLAGGVVPLLVVYGLQLLSPGIFLVACCLICAVVSVVTGSSWTTAATIGVALIGVGEGLEISKAMTAGAIVSGAYFGDKLSPLSDTTNLAAGVAEVPLFGHIRHMLWTTIPSMAMALGIYALLGLGAGGESNQAQISLLVETAERSFSLSPLLLLAPLSVIACLLLRMPALGAILVGGAVGAVLALTIQGMAPTELVGVIEEGFELNTGVASLNELLSGGGLSSMYSTIGLVLCALSFGGLLECTGMLGTIVRAILKFAINTGRLVGSTLVSSVGVNLLTADQYLSIILPGRMYGDAYRKAGLDARNLSRCLEDAGTMTSPLIFWNTCGAAMLGALTVSPFLFAPFAFFNLLCPLISALYGFTGWTMMPRGLPPGERD